MDVFVQQVDLKSNHKPPPGRQLPLLSRVLFFWRQKGKRNFQLFVEGVKKKSTLCKTNITPEKNGGWETILSFWVSAYS